MISVRLPDLPKGKEFEEYIAIGEDGMIYVGSRDHYLYAIKRSSGGLADTPWPMFHHNVRHRGKVR